MKLAARAEAAAKSKRANQPSITADVILPKPGNLTNIQAKAALPEEPVSIASSSS